MEVSPLPHQVFLRRGREKIPVPLGQVLIAGFVDYAVDDLRWPQGLYQFKNSDPRRRNLVSKDGVAASIEVIDYFVLDGDNLLSDHGQYGEAHDPLPFALVGLSRLLLEKRSSSSNGNGSRTFVHLPGEPAGSNGHAPIYGAIQKAYLFAKPIRYRQEKWEKAVAASLNGHS